MSSITPTIINARSLSWHLEAPSVSGGKVYKITVVDNVAVVCWGSVTSYSRQYRVHTFNTPAGARAFAAEQTGKKEAKGYRLVLEPYVREVSPNVVARLRTMEHHRGSSTFLGGLFGRE